MEPLKNAADKRLNALACDCCNELSRELVRCWPMGIETFACPKCRGVEENAYGDLDEDECTAKTAPSE